MAIFSNFINSSQMKQGKTDIDDVRSFMLTTFKNDSAYSTEKGLA